MRKRAIHVTAVALAVAVVSLAGVASAREKPIVVQTGNLVLTVNGGVTPKTLPKNEMVPIGFHGQAHLGTLDGSHPPAFEETIFDIDKDVAVDVSSLPVCHRGRLESRTTAEARRACPGAILGNGTVKVEVAFPEQQPIESTGPLVFFNGGERNGVTTFYVHAYVAVPAPTAVITVVKATREAKGPYGLRVVAHDPVVAGGSGSATFFSLHIFRYVEVDGRKRGFLFARCGDGRLQARATAKFRDGTTMFGGVARAC